MSYRYSANNRLIEPHNYMYTPFEGASLFQAFFDARADALRHFEMISSKVSANSPEVIASACLIDHSLAERSPGTHKHWRTLFGADTNLDGAQQDVIAARSAEGAPKKFSIAHEVATSELLSRVIASMLDGCQGADTGAWLDRLIQRFEVTKRLYETYLPGFRKGEGNFDSPRRYWLFALALCLVLCRSRNLRALNTLLKVCDLLCSLETSVVGQQVSVTGMRVVLAMEGASVRALIDEKRCANAV